FTGLRIGISSIQGLALGHARPCVGISTLDVLAARARGLGSAIAAVMDARRAPPGAAYIGGGALRYREAILAQDARAVFPERSLFLAGTLARLAAPRLARGE